MLIIIFAIRNQYTIVARCDGLHGILYTRGGNCTRGEAEGTNCPPRVYKTHGPQSQRATIVLLYLGNINIPLLKVLLSPSNIITTEYSFFNKQMNKKQFLTVPSNPRVFRTQCWKATNTGNDRGDVHRCTSLFPTPSHVTCVFVARHVIGSRPIKLHSLLPRYNKLFCSSSLALVTLMSM